MAAISRAQLLKELLPGLNALFGMEYKRYEEEHKALYEVENSDRSFEEETKLSGFGAAPVKNEGASIVYDNAQEAWTTRYTHETIALGFAITEEAIEDNLYDSLSARYTKALARAMAHTKQVKAAAVINNGFNGNFAGGDGVSLFGNNTSGTRVGHSLVGGGVNFNSPSVGADLNETSLEAAMIDIAGWVDERGLLIAAKGVKLVIPRQLMYVAERILKSELRTSLSAVNTFAPNDVNAIKSMGQFQNGVTVNHYLTDPNGWYIKTDIPNGMKMFVRRGMKTGMDTEFDTGNARYKASERYSFGWSEPLAMWGSPGA